MHTCTHTHTHTHTHTQRLPTEALRNFCQQCLELTENAAHMGPDDEPMKSVTIDLKKLHTTIKQHAGEGVACQYKALPTLVWSGRL